MTCFGLVNQSFISSGLPALAEQADGLPLYRIFKDADALDRFRLGPSGLDVWYLRTETAKALYDYAKHVWQAWA